MLARSDSQGYIVQRRPHDRHTFRGASFSSARSMTNYGNVFKFNKRRDVFIPVTKSPSR